MGRANVARERLFSMIQFESLCFLYVKQSFRNNLEAKIITENQSVEHAAGQVVLRLFFAKASAAQHHVHETARNCAVPKLRKMKLNAPKSFWVYNSEQVREI